MTPAERQLWYRLQRKNLGVKFRRQEPIQSFIVDFVCYPANLIIELDGGQHSENQNDKIRDAKLTSLGFTVIRFWNNEVLENIEGVLIQINKYLRPLPNPPHKGEGKEK